MRVVAVLLLLLAAPVLAQAPPADPEIVDPRGDTDLPSLDIVGVGFDRDTEGVPRIHLDLAGVVPPIDEGTCGFLGAKTDYRVDFELLDARGQRLGGRAEQYAALNVYEMCSYAYLCLWFEGQGECRPTAEASIDGARITWTFDAAVLREPDIAWPLWFDNVSATTEGALMGGGIEGDRAPDAGVARASPQQSPPTTLPPAGAPAPARPAGIGTSLAAATAAIGAVIAFAVARSMTRGTLPRALIPAALFTRIQRDKVLQHERRAAIVAAVEAEPGITFSELRRLLDIGSGSLAHHLKVLEQQGLVAHRGDGTRRRFLVRGPAITLGPYLAPTQRALLTAVERHPGSTPSNIAARIGVPRHVAQYHLSRLLEAGYVSRRRDGRHARYFA